MSEPGENSFVLISSDSAYKCLFDSARTDSGNSTNSGSGHASSNGHTLSLAVGGGSGGKQPPISRPVSGSTSSGNNNIINNNSFSNGSLLGGGLAASILAGGGGSGGSGVSSFNGVPLSGPLHGLLDRQGGGKHSSYGFHSSLSMSPGKILGIGRMCLRPHVRTLREFVAYHFLD